MSRLAILKMAALIGAAALSGPAGAADKQRWQMPEGQVRYAPICPSYAAPVLGEVPKGGLVPVFLFSIKGASPEQEAQLRGALASNSMIVAPGTTRIAGTRILFAAGDGRVREQKTADAVFKAMCRSETPNIRLVHARYNLPSDVNRMN
ncbi:hypothetical protein [Sphingomonas humi]|uniref:SPOR domain-containing protein n=1 Tax=Sphingomonas humi TaxID=335630 RepID=A0ABP7S759_9SPHN